MFLDPRIACRKLSSVIGNTICCIIENGNSYAVKHLSCRYALYLTCFCFFFLFLNLEGCLSPMLQGHNLIKDLVEQVTEYRFFYSGVMGSITLICIICTYLNCQQKELDPDSRSKANI